MLKTYFSEGSMLTNVERIMILLTESGFVYSAIWVSSQSVLSARFLSDALLLQLLVVIYQVGINMGHAYDQDTFHDNYWGVIGYFVNGGLVPTIVRTSL